MKLQTDRRQTKRSVALLSTVGCQTYDREVVGLIFGRAAIKRLLLGWATIYKQVNHLGI